MRDQGDRNPLLRSLVWVLVAVGILGLGVLGAQRFLFNNGDEKPAPIAASKPAPTDPQTPVPVPKEKPSPMPPPVKEQRDTTPPTDQQPKPDVRRTRTDVPQPQPGGDHTVGFVTDPPGANLTVDSLSALSCHTPCMLTLPAGRHVLKLQMDGYRMYPKIIMVPQDNDVFIKLSKAVGSLSITSNPSGAAILLDGQQQAQTTPAVFHLAPGMHHVRVSRNGVPLDFDVNVPDGDLISKSVNFQ